MAPFTPRPKLVSVGNVNRFAPGFSGQIATTDMHLELREKHFASRHLVYQRIQPLDQQKLIVSSARVNGWKMRRWKKTQQELQTQLRNSALKGTELGRFAVSKTLSAATASRRSQESVPSANHTRIKTCSRANFASLLIMFRHSSETRLWRQVSVSELFVSAHLVVG